MAQDAKENLDYTECNYQNRLDLVMQKSINCNYKNGITINDKGVILNMNGSSIIGSGYLNPFIGIEIFDTENITITGEGKIAHFQTGILINNSKNIEISSVNLTGNEFAISIINSSGIYLDMNQLYTNTAGINAKSVNDSIIADSYFDSNDLYSVAFFQSNNNTISTNFISSSLNAIYIDPNSFDISVSSNHFTRNSGSDINYGNGADVNESDIIISNNSCSLSIPIGFCN